MPVPSSGTLRLRADIALEVDGSASGTNVRLGTLSDTAGFSAPDRMSDFRGFSASIFNDSFINQAIYFNDGNPLIHQKNQEELDYLGLGENDHGYAKAFLAGTNIYRGFTRLNNDNGFKTSLINAAGTDVGSQSWRTNNFYGNPGTNFNSYDYPAGENAYKGSLSQRSTLKEGKFFAILAANIQGGRVPNSTETALYREYSSGLFQINDNYIDLYTLLNQNYSQAAGSLADGVYCFVFNYGLWKPRTIDSRSAGGVLTNKLRFSEFQVYYAKID